MFPILRMPILEFIKFFGKKYAINYYQMNFLEDVCLFHQ